MRIDLINLDRSQDRLSEFWRFNGHLNKNVQRHSGVDGSKQDISALLANGIIDAEIAKTYSRGAIGAALSHAAMWTRAIETNETLTICEDDAIFNFDYARSAENVVSALEPDWDFILWGWNFDAALLFELLPGVSACLANFDQNRMVAGVHRFQELSIAPLSFRLLRGFGGPCYSVTPKGARALKAGCIPIRDMSIFFPGLDRQIANCGVDVMMNAVYPSIKAYVAFPPLVVTKNELSKSLSQTTATR